MSKAQDQRQCSAAGARAGARTLMLAVVACLAVLALPGVAAASDPFGDLTGSSAGGLGTPTISSDKADYAPGETVVLTGDNWLPGEHVHITVNDNVGQTWVRDSDVNADASGSIRDEFQLPTSFIAEYAVTAVGDASGTAQTTFTDGNLKISVTPSGVTASIRERLYDTSTNCTGDVKKDTTVAITSTTPDTLGVGSNESARLDAPSPASTGQTFVNWTKPAGSTLVFTVIGATGGQSVCVQGPSGSDDITANYAAANTAPTVAANNASVAVNEGQTANNTGTYSDTNTGDNVTITASRGTVTKTGTNSGTWSWSLATTDGPEDSGTITITANDGHGGITTTTFSLTVANVAPTVVVSGDASANEGQTKTYTYTVTDPGADPNPTVTESCGANATKTDTPAANSFDCTFTDGPATSTVRVTANDGDPTNNSGFGELTVTVANVAPTVDLSGADTADEGQTKTYTYTVSDPGADPNPAVTESCGANATKTDTPAANSFDCTFTDGPATSTVKVTADDGDPTNNVGSDEISVAVANVAPTVELSGAASADEGQTKTYTYTVSDPGDDPNPTVTESCGTGGDKTDTPAANSFDCTFADGPATSTVKVTADDGDPTNNVGSDEISVAVANVAPTVELSGAASADEGQTKTYTYTVSDPGDDPNPTVTESCGTGGVKTDTPAANSFDCTFPDGPATPTVKVTADDGDLTNNVGSDEVGVTVSNVAPKVELTGAETANEGDTKTYSFTVSDPGQDTFTVDSGYPDCDAGATDNGTLVSGSVTITASGGSFDCKFADGPATANVKIKVTDSDLDSTTDSEAVTIVAVANVAPTVVLSGAASADEGQTKTYTYTVSDPGDDPNPTITESCGTGGVKTDTAAANSFDCKFPDGPATPKVEVTADDGDPTNNIGSDDIDVSVANVAPTVVLTGAAAANEGQTKTYTYSVTDPGNDPNPTITETCGTGGVKTDTAAANSFDCKFPDGPATPKVEVTADDGDLTNNIGSDDIDVSVANVAPTVNLTGAETANEGETKTYSFTVSDPGVDTFTVDSGYPDCDAGPSDNGTLVTDSLTTTASGGSFQCKFADGPATANVKIKVTDSDLDSTTDSEAVQIVAVANVAPTVVVFGDASANEGDTKTYTYTVTDPGDDPNPTITESCGTGGVKTDTAAANSFDCTFADGPATPKVEVTANDGDDTGSGELNVTVANVAPTVVLTGAASANEGQTKTYTYSVTDPGNDPNPTITETCGTGGVRTDTPAANSFECKFPDGPATPKVKVTANDGDLTNNVGFDEIDVDVANVAPDITSFTGTDSFAGPLAFIPSVFTTDFTDPGRPTDTHRAEFTWSDSASVQTVNPFVTGQKVTHTFAAGCDRGATVKVIDKDTDFDTASTTVDVGTGAWLPPLANQPVSDKLKNGQVLPVKVRLTDCSGATVNGLSPYIELAKGDLTAVSDDPTETIVINSVSSADTGQIMRQMADGSYIYNLRVSLASSEIGKDWTIVVYPYGKSAGGATLRHVIVATK